MDNALLSISQQFSGLPMESLIGGPLNAAANANAAMAVTQTKFLLNTCFKVDEKPEQGEEQGQVGDPAKGVPAKVKRPKIEKHDNYTPIMIKMTLIRSVITPGTAGTPAGPNGKPAAVPAKPTSIDAFETAFDLPLLTIIPLNSLAVETVDIAFEMEVKSSFSEETTESKEKEVKSAGSFAAKAGWGPFSVTVKGSASYDSKESQSKNTHYQKSNSAKYTVNVHAGQLPLPTGVTTIIDAFSKSIQPIDLKPAS